MVPQVQEDGSDTKTVRGAELRAMVRSYYDLQDTRVAINNRLVHLDAPKKDLYLLEMSDEVEMLEDHLEREMEKEVGRFEFYRDYLKKIRGIAGKMGSVLMVELCLPRAFTRMKDRDGSPRNYESVQEKYEDDNGNTCWDVTAPPVVAVATKCTNLWSYCGYGDAKKDKRTSGEKSSHNPFIKKKLHTIAENFLRTGSHYRRFYDKKKEYYQNSDDHEDWSKGHIHQASLRVMKKIFLSHLYEVWRTWNGYNVVEPYVFIHEPGHADYIPPFIEDGEGVHEIL